MSLTRKTQLGFVLEDIENSAKTVTAADALPVRPVPNFTPNFGRFERNLAKDSLDAELGVSGLQSGTVNFVMDLQGSADLDASTPSPLSRPLQACGMREYVAKAVGYASFSAGTVTTMAESYTQATSNATGIVVGVFRGGDTIACLFPAPGSAALTTGQLITCATSGVTFTPTAVGDMFAYRPNSLKTSSIAITTIKGAGFAVGDEIEQDQGSGVFARGRVTEDLAVAGTLYFEPWLGSASFDDSADVNVTGTSGTDGGTPTGSASATQATTPSATIVWNNDGHGMTMRGARGNFSLQLTNGEIGQVTFDFTGVLNAPDDIAPFAFPGDGATPPRATGGSYRWGDDLEYLPYLQQMGYNLGNNVALRENMNDASGYAGTVIGSRAPTASANPEKVYEAIWPHLGNAYTQAAFRQRSQVGQVGNGNGNAFQIYATRLQSSASNPGDRVGERIVDETYACTGANDESLMIYVI